mgnify:FL=1
MPPEPGLAGVVINLKALSVIIRTGLCLQWMLGIFLSGKGARGLGAVSKYKILFKSKETALFTQGVYSHGTGPEQKGLDDAVIWQKMYLAPVSVAD